MNITYDEMIPVMHKTYRSTNIARKVTLFLSIALIVIVSIDFLNLAESEVSRRSLQVFR